MMFFPVPAIEIDANPKPIMGTTGTLKTIPIASLHVDLQFQRGMTVGSARNARMIAAAFDWRRFVPVVVVEAGDGAYSIVDGQHRTAAAKARGIKAVPCYVLQASLADAAQAFAAINGAVTPMRSDDLFRAQVVAGEPEAVALKALLDDVGVRIVSGGQDYRKGDTRALKALRRARTVYGEDVLRLVLRCIVETGDGNAGMVTGGMINAMALTLLRKPEWLHAPSQVFDRLDTVRLSDLFNTAFEVYVRTKTPTQFTLEKLLREVLGVATQPRAKVAA